MSKKLVPLVTAAVAVALLAGCSAGGSGSDGGTTAAAKEQTKSQSKAEACKTFSSEVSDATQGLQSQITALQSDPEAAVAKLDDLNATLKDSASKVTNSEVKPKTDAFAAAFADFTSKTKAVADAKDASALSSSGFTESLEKLQSTGKDFQEVCTAG